MSLCYFVTCHASADFVLEQFSYIYRPNGLYLYHVDAKAPARLHACVAELAKAQNVYVLPSRHYSWAGFSQVETSLEAMRVGNMMAEADQCVAWEHFIFLSEQHLPLVSQEEVRSRLAGSGAVFASSRFRDMSPEGQADMANRFAMTYRELLGVGMFGVSTANPDDAFFDRLYHSVNWLILSRETVAYIIRKVPVWPDFDRFRQSVHADETLLPTIIGNCSIEINHHNYDTSFIASPAHSGNEAMEFSEQNFFDARSNGYLFIRKRPVELPSRVCEHLQSFATVSSDWLAEITSSLVTPAMQKPDADLAQNIVLLMREVMTDLKAERLDNVGLAPVPRILLSLATPRMAPDLRVVIISETTIEFRVLLVSHQPFNDSFESARIHGVDSPLLRVKIWGLWFARELPLEDADFGFVTISDKDGSVDVANKAVAYIEAAERLAA